MLPPAAYQGSHLPAPRPMLCVPNFLYLPIYIIKILSLCYFNLHFYQLKIDIVTPLTFPFFSSMHYHFFVYFLVYFSLMCKYFVKKLCKSQILTFRHIHYIYHKCSQGFLVFLLIHLYFIIRTFYLGMQMLYFSPLWFLVQCQPKKVFLQSKIYDLPELLF